MKITWIGTADNVKGNIEFATDRGQNVTLTAEEIKALYETSIKGNTQRTRQDCRCVGNRRMV